MTAHNDPYVKLHGLMSVAANASRATDSTGFAKDVLDAIVPEIVELLAKVYEYEHALEHVADKRTHEELSQVFCEDCAQLAQSAFDGVNREMCREMAQEDLSSG